jgi:hypothetical protein
MKTIALKTLYEGHYIMKAELLKTLEELNGLIYKGLREDNPENKMISAMHIALQLGQLRMMVEKLDKSYLTSDRVLSAVQKNTL